MFGECSKWDMFVVENTGTEATRSASWSAGLNIYLVPQSIFKFHPSFDAAIRGVLDSDPLGEDEATSARSGATIPLRRDERGERSEARRGPNTPQQRCTPKRRCALRRPSERAALSLRVATSVGPVELIR